MKTFDKEYETIVRGLDWDIKGQQKAKNTVKKSDTYWGGKPTAISFLPNGYLTEVRNKLISYSKNLYNILTKIYRHYIDDIQYRNLFNFDKKIEELLLLKNDYGELIPFMRSDIIYSEEKKQFYFCEFNTDACGGMIESSVAYNAIRESQSFKCFEKKYDFFEDTALPIYGWIDRVKELILETKKFKDYRNINVAIVACVDSELSEKNILTSMAKIFKAQGLNTAVFDIRNIGFDGKSLIGHKALYGENEMKIDVVWKYSIIVDMIKYWDEIAPFIEGIKKDAAIVIGNIGTQIIHDKQIFAILQKKETKEFLTSDEIEFVDKHIPKTFFLEDVENIENIIEDKANWIIKPTDWYGSIDVFDGKSQSDLEWRTLVNKCKNDKSGKRWIVQEFINPSKSLTIPIYSEDEELYKKSVLYGELFGMYTICGEYAGVYLRKGPCNVISDKNKGVTGLILWIKNKEY